MLNYKDYKLIKPDKSFSDRLNNFILENNGSIFHEVALNQIIESSFHTKLYYLVDNPLDIHNAAVVHAINIKFGLKKYHLRPLFDMPYGGFIGNDDVEFDKFSIGLFDSINYAGFPYKTDIQDKNPEAKHGETAMVDLSLSEHDIFSKVIHTKRRNMIRKAIKENIHIKTYFSLDGLIEFWKLLKPLHDKLGYYQLTFGYYKEIFQHYSASQQAAVLLAFKNNILLAGIFVLGNRNYMHYFKGASSLQLLNEGQGELLQWEAIKLSKSLGARYYDLCNLDKERLPDIYRFKTGISKNIMKYPIYNRNAMGYKIVNRIFKML